jgi:hypothetical protein
MMNTVLDSMVSRIQRQFQGKRAAGTRRRRHRRGCVDRKQVPARRPQRVPEWQVVEQLLRLLQDPDSEPSRAALADFLEQIPGQTLLSVLSENLKAGFLPADGMGRVLQALPLRRITRLANETSAEQAVALFGHEPVLERIRQVMDALAVGEACAWCGQLFEPGAGKLVTLALCDAPGAANENRLVKLLARLVNDRQTLSLTVSLLLAAQPSPATGHQIEDRRLKELWQQHPALMEDLAAHAPDRWFVLAQRLMAQHTGGFQLGDPELARLVPRLFVGLDNRLGWDLLCSFAQLLEGVEKADAMAWLLSTLGPQKAADMVSERFSDAELRIYWILLPADVKQELKQRGRGPARRWREASRAAGEARRKRWAGARAGAGWGPRRDRDWYRRSDPTPRSSEQRAMETMRRRFGFSEGMTYQQARQQYWALAMELHPDRTGGDPDAAERLQDLNNAWACTRDRFRSNRARPACFAGAR